MSEISSYIDVREDTKNLLTDIINNKSCVDYSCVGCILYRSCAINVKSTQTMTGPLVLDKLIKHRREAALKMFITIYGEASLFEVIL